MQKSCWLLVSRWIIPTNRKTTQYFLNLAQPLPNIRVFVSLELNALSVQLRRTVFLSFTIVQIQFALITKFRFKGMWGDFIDLFIELWITLLFFAFLVKHRIPTALILGNIHILLGISTTLDFLLEGFEIMKWAISQSNMCGTVFAVAHRHIVIPVKLRSHLCILANCLL